MNPDDVAEPPRIPDCPECRAPLDLWQPRVEDPDRVVGICRRCGALYACAPTGDGFVRAARIAGPSQPKSIATQ